MDRLPKALLEIRSGRRATPGDVDLLKHAANHFRELALPPLNDRTLLRDEAEEFNRWACEWDHEHPEVLDALVSSATTMKLACHRVGLENIAKLFDVFCHADYTDCGLSLYISLCFVAVALYSSPDLTSEIENARIVIEFYNFIATKGEYHTDYNRSEEWGSVPGLVWSYILLLDLFDYQKLAKDIREQFNLHQPGGDFLLFLKIKTCETLTDKACGQFAVVFQEDGTITLSENRPEPGGAVTVEFRGDFMEASVLGPGRRTQTYQLATYSGGDVARVLRFLFIKWQENPRKYTRWEDCYGSLSRRKGRPSRTEWRERSPWEFFRPAWRDRKDNEQFFQEFLEYSQQENPRTRSVFYELRLKADGIRYTAREPDNPGPRPGPKRAPRRLLHG
jgi:hypothetical protein